MGYKTCTLLATVDLSIDRKGLWLTKGQDQITFGLRNQGMLHGRDGIHVLKSQNANGIGP